MKWQQGRGRGTRKKRSATDKKGDLPRNKKRTMTERKGRVQKNEEEGVWLDSKGSTPRGGD